MATASAGRLDGKKTVYSTTYSAASAPLARNEDRRNTFPLVITLQDDGPPEGASHRRDPLKPLPGRPHGAHMEHEDPRFAGMAAPPWDGGRRQS